MIVFRFLINRKQQKIYKILMTRRHDTVYIHVQAKQRKKENDHILHIFSKKQRY